MLTESTTDQSPVINKRSLRIKLYGGPSPYKRHQKPVRTIDPVRKELMDTGQMSGKRKPNNVEESFRFKGDYSRGRYRTGLDAKVSNPFKGLTAIQLRSSYGLDNSWTNDLLELISAEDEISKQFLFEILDGVPYDYYTSVMRPEIRQGGTPFALENPENKTFIEGFEVVCYEGVNAFSNDTPRGRMCIQCLEISEKVAKNLQELNKDMHRAYITSEEEELADRARLDDLENEASSYLYHLANDMAPESSYAIAVLLNEAQGQLSQRQVQKILNKYVKAKSTGGRNDRVDRINLFIKYYKELKENFALFQCRYLVKQAELVREVYIDAGRVYWKSKSNVPAHYEWPTHEALISVLFKDMEDYDPTREGSSNLYGDMYSVLTEKYKIIKLTAS